MFTKEHALTGIVGMGLRQEIGQKGGLPWHNKKEQYSDDLQFYKAKTRGVTVDKQGNEITRPHPCIYASKTWESLPGFLKRQTERPSIVVTSKTAAELELPEHVYRASSPEEAVEIAKGLPNSEEIYLCGGSSLYTWAIDNADELLVTEIPESFPDADTFFPEFKTKGWKEVERWRSSNNQCDFVRYIRA